MSKRGKFFQRLMGGQSDKTIDFDQLCDLLRTLGFAERITGSHHVFTIQGLERLIDLQPAAGTPSPIRCARCAIS